MAGANAATIDHLSALWHPLSASRAMRLSPSRLRVFAVDGDDLIGDL
jgi:hypothetical protein